MGDPQQVVWDDESKAAPAAASSSKVQWDDAGQAKPAATAAAPRVQASNAPSVPSGSDWLSHPFKSAGQSIDIASQYYGAKGDKDESIAKGVGKSLGRTATMIPSAVAHPYDALVGGNLELKKRADEEAAQGKTSESMLHSVAAGIPIAGPLAVSIGERLGGTSTQAPTKSDIAGGLTDIATLIAAPKIGEAVKEGAAPGGVLRRGVTTPTTPVGEGAPALPTVKGVVDAAANTTPGRQAAAAAKYVVPAVKGFASDLPGVKGAVKAVENVKAAKAAIAESDARAADYKQASEQAELARSGAKDVPQYRDVPVASEGRPAGFPDRLTERVTPDGKAQILDNEGKPFIGERSARMTDAEVADRAKQRGVSVDDYKQQIRQTQSRPNIAESPKTESPQATPTANIGKQWTEPTFDELSSNIKRVGRAGESKAAKANAAVADAEGNLKSQHGGAVDSSVKDTQTSLGQFAKANGPRIDAAVGTTPEGQTLANHIHSMTGPDIAKVAEKAGVEPEYKSGKSGKKSLDREATFNKMLDAGETPESIVDRHYQRLGNPPPVSGGAPDIGRNLMSADQIRQRMSDPNVRAQNHMGNELMADRHATAPRLPGRIPQLNDLASQVKNAGPEELQELDRMGQNLYRDTKGNIVKAYSGQPKPNVAESPKTAAAKPNIAEAPEVKVWRDQAGEEHPVKIKYEHGVPTDVDGRHRVIQAFKEGYDRIEVTVDRGHGAQKITVPVKTIMNEMGVDEASLAKTDAQQTKIRAGGLKPRIAVTKRQ